uniref:Uncharacterized protein n=1 Tax=Vitrella brassicaformis TaxID=1169539 RepID=A0A7S1KBU8_9ALVE|mmetsp:Transcript_46270/g.115097  ORF Transcript_46270/g.115097 Transcript_46270/m.115097 type:complete len:136 (+) Transcript_46270:359-766(+)
MHSFIHSFMVLVWCADVFIHRQKCAKVCVCTGGKLGVGCLHRTYRHAVFDARIGLSGWVAGWLAGFSVVRCCDAARDACRVTACDDCERLTKTAVNAEVANKYTAHFASIQVCVAVRCSEQTDRLTHKHTNARER